MRTALIAGLLFLAAVACSGTAYRPTIEDYTLGVYQVARKATTVDRLLPDYDQFAAVFIGRTCVDGGELSSGEFRSFVAQTLESSAISVAAKDLINEMLARVKAGTETSCMRPFFYPETGVELTLASSLVKGAYVVQMAPIFRRLGLENVETQAYEWFVRESSKGESYLEWACRKRSCAPSTGPIAPPIRGPGMAP